MDNEHQRQTAAPAVHAMAASACPHPDAVGTRWSDPISEERQTELQGYLDRWASETDHGNYKGPFHVRPGDRLTWLTGADVFWLAERSGRDEYDWVPNLHLEGTDLSLAHLEGADLRGAHLEGVSASHTHLEGAQLDSAHLERANFTRAHLEHASLGAYLDGALLGFAHLDGADLRGAHLGGGDLSNAYLEGAALNDAQVEAADLRNAWMDKATLLNNVALNSASLDQLSFDGANLAVVNWETVRVLGDEVRARAAKDEVGIRKTRQIRLNDYEAAVRAHLQLAAVMRSQGMRDQADRFSYRAQVLQRGVLRYRLRFGAALGSKFLDLISGYGYRPMRSFVTYVLVILAFAAAYLTLGSSSGNPLTWNEAIVISMTAFHGRGFFSSVFQPGDLQAAVAAIEAFVGLLIEIVFIATFTQRFFAR